MAYLNKAVDMMSRSRESTAPSASEGVEPTARPDNWREIINPKEAEEKKKAEEEAALKKQKEQEEENKKKSAQVDSKSLENAIGGRKMQRSSALPDGMESALEKELDVCYNTVLLEYIWQKSAEDQVPYLPDYIVSEASHSTQLNQNFEGKSPSELKAVGNQAWLESRELNKKLDAMKKEAADQDIVDTDIKKLQHEVDLKAFIARMSFTRAISVMDGQYRDKKDFSITALSQADRILLTQLYSNRSMVGTALVGAETIPNLVAPALAPLLDATRACIFAVYPANGYKPFYRGMIGAMAVGKLEIAQQFARKAMEIKEAQQDPTVSQLAQELLKVAAKKDDGSDYNKAATATKAAGTKIPKMVATDAELKEYHQTLLKTFEAFLKSRGGKEARTKMLAAINQFEKCGYLSATEGKVEIDVDLLAPISILAESAGFSNLHSRSAQMYGWMINLSSRSPVVGKRQTLAPQPDAPNVEAPFLNQLWLDAVMACAKDCHHGKKAVNPLVDRVLNSVLEGKRSKASSATQKFFAGYLMLCSAQSTAVSLEDPDAAYKFTTSRRRYHEFVKQYVTAALSENASDQERLVPVITEFRKNSDELRIALENGIRNIEQTLGIKN